MWGRVGERIHTLARLNLERRWTTSWGPGRVLNALFFKDNRVLPESQDDLKKHISKSMFCTGKAVAIFATFLFWNPFGEAIMTAGPAPEPALLGDASCRLNTFFYKLCELRKVNAKGRGGWYRVWKKKPAREALKKCIKHYIAKPAFSKRRK